MQRYILVENEPFQLADANFHHAIHVMRYKVDSQLLVVYQGTTHLCRIKSIGKNSAELETIQRIEEWNELPIQVTLLAGLTKADKFEWMIQKSTELGVAEIVPFLADRSVVKWDDKSYGKKTRWQTIAKEAAEQSHRSQLPLIRNPISHNELTSFSSAFHVKLVADEEIAKQRDSEGRLYEYLSNVSVESKLLIAVGPEGGFSDRERQLFRDASFLTIGLGPRILRAETAPIYLLSVLSYHFEQMR